MLPLSIVHVKEYIPTANNSWNYYKHDLLLHKGEIIIIGREFFSQNFDNIDNKHLKLSLKDNKLEIRNLSTHHNTSVNDSNNNRNQLLNDAPILINDQETIKLVLAPKNKNDKSLIKGEDNND